MSDSGRVNEATRLQRRFAHSTEAQLARRRKKMHDQTEALRRKFDRAPKEALWERRTGSSSTKTDS